MNEKMKKTMKRSLALMLALILVIGAGTWMRDGSLKADEEAPEARVVVEEAAPAEAPAPAPVEEPVVVVQQVELTPEPPAEAEPAVEEPAAAEEKQEAEAEQPAEEPAASEEEQNAEAPEDDADASFDVEEAYEYYMSLGSDEEKVSYLDSLDAADRKALEDYIAGQAEPAAVMLAAAGEEAEAEPVAAEDGVLDVPEQGEEPGAEAEPEVQAAPTAFGSMKVSGEWAGRNTSSRRAINIEVYVDGALADVCYAEMNMSVANFSVAIGDCTIDSVNSTCGAFSGSNGSYAVDMYADTNVTVTVNLSSPVVEIEEEPVAEEPAAEAEPVPAEDGVLDAPEQDEEPEVTVAEDEATVEAEPEVTVAEDEATVEAEPEVTVAEDEVTAEAEELEVTVSEDEKTLDAEDAEEEITFSFVRDEEGNLVLDENGNPVIEVEGDRKVAIEYERDEEGNLVLDENGDPVVLKVEQKQEYTGEVGMHLELVSGNSIGVGSRVRWVSEILGDAEGLELTYQWLETADGGENWYPIEGANEPDYEFEVTAENINHLWKVRVL